MHPAFFVPHEYYRHLIVRNKNVVLFARLLMTVMVSGKLRIKKW